jgi:hypothetical protein
MQVLPPVSFSIAPELLHDLTHFKLSEFYLVLYLCLYDDVCERSRDSAVGIATDYELNDRGVGVRVPVVSRIFSTSSRPALRFTQLLLQWVPGPLSPGIKPGREGSTEIECRPIHPLRRTPTWRNV